MAASPSKLDQLPVDDAFELVNILIGGGKFECALEVAKLIIEIDGIHSVGKAFNTAIAYWGLAGKPNVSHFGRVIELAPLAVDYEAEPNFIQCLALSQAVVGDRASMKISLKRALQEIQGLASGRQFSCWTYTNVSRADFEEHCRSIEQFGLGEGPPPAVVVIN